MKLNSIEPIKGQLQKERTQFNAKAEKLRSELAAVEADALLLDAAIAALDGAQSASRNGHATLSKERRKTIMPASGKADVIKLIRNILEEQQVIKREALKAMVEASLTNAGFSRLGFSLRFKEALASLQFVETPDGLRLNPESEYAEELTPKAL